MKTLIKLVAACLLALVVILLVRYHSVDPCRILEREMVSRVERETRAARDSVREAAGRLAGEDAQHATDRVAVAVENVAVGVATGLAKTRVASMSRSQCVAEMWHLAVHDRTSQ